LTAIQIYYRRIHAANGIFPVSIKSAKKISDFVNLLPASCIYKIDVIFESRKGGGRMAQDTFADLYRSLIAYYRLPDEQAAWQLKLILDRLDALHARNQKNETGSEGGVFH
jgi:hypothetical protein